MLKMPHIHHSFLKVYFTFWLIITLAVVVPIFAGYNKSSFNTQGWAAATKRKKLTPTVMKKELATLQPEIVKLLGKSRSKALFTPADSDQINTIRETLNWLMTGLPKSPELIEPAYQAGQLFLARELFFDSVEAFSFIETQAPTSPYAPKATYLKRLAFKKMSPEDRLLLEVPSVYTAPTSLPSPTTLPATGGAVTPATTTPAPPATTTAPAVTTKPTATVPTKAVTPPAKGAVAPKK
jgi:hypothetical protein